MVSQRTKAGMWGTGIVLTQRVVRPKDSMSAERVRALAGL